MAEMWHIEPQLTRKTTVLQPGGVGFTDVWEVHYVIDHGPAQGIASSVSIPAAQYSAENVRKAVQDAVDAHNEVAAL